MMINHFFRGIVLILISVICYFGSVIKSVRLNKPQTLYHTSVEEVPSPVTYFIHPTLGDDSNPGTSKEKPFKTLQQIEKITLNPGDQVILAGGEQYTGSLILKNRQGSENYPIEIKSENWNNEKENTPAIIDFKGHATGILIEDCSYLNISNINVTGNGFGDYNEISDMRCAILINDADQRTMTSIRMNNLHINDVYYENPGFIRDKSEVKSANGIQKYGWGIRVTNKQPDHLIENIEISNCEISNVSHTGIKLTGSKKNIRRVNILHNTVKYTGGPGMQMSEVENVYVAYNVIDHSGSDNDSRKWGRGSGLWTWGSANVIIEKNKFLHANGPGDSDGAHIDFNCLNIIIQYNLSAFNAGGFCEILGNNYNCVYRYNISINDGYRVKGINGAFQEGKTLWLSGYQGNNQLRKGPFNSYIYNNTIYADSSLQPKIAFANTSNGVLIANNIFYSFNPFQLVLGDQNKADINSNEIIENMHIKNNLFLKANSLPKEMEVYTSNSFFGNPGFKNPGGTNPEDYIPLNIEMVRNKGMKESGTKINGTDTSFSLHTGKDILGKSIPDYPSIGAIEPGN